MVVGLLLLHEWSRWAGKGMFPFKICAVLTPFPLVFACESPPPTFVWWPLLAIITAMPSGWDIGKHSGAISPCHGQKYYM